MRCKKWGLFQRRKNKFIQLNINLCVLFDNFGLLEQKVYVFGLDW